MVKKFLSAGLFAVALGVALPVSARSFFTIWVDDGLAEGTKKAHAILNASGIKGTFCVPTGFLNRVGHITSGELASIAANWHDICGHTVTHPELTGLVRDEISMRYQLWQSKDSLETFLRSTRVNVVVFAYPAGIGDDNAIVRANVARFYNAARTTDWGIAYPTTDPLAIPSFSFESIFDLNFWKGKALDARNSGGWINFVVHDVDQAGRPYNISSADLSALIAYMKSIGMLPITGEQGVHLVLNREIVH